MSETRTAYETIKPKSYKTEPYWLLEKPEKVKTDKLCLSYFPNAGKLQIACYFTKDGQGLQAKVVTIDQEDLALNSQARRLILKVLEEWQG